MRCRLLCASPTSSMASGKMCPASFMQRTPGHIHHRTRQLRRFMRGGEREHGCGGNKQRIALLLPDTYRAAHDYFRPFLTPRADDCWDDVQFVVNPGEGEFAAV